MQLLDGQIVLSASDLVNFVACPHLSHLDLQSALGLEHIQATRNETATLVAAKGDEHERRHLAQLEAEGRHIVAIEGPRDGSRAEILRAAADTEAAMRAGADVVYQGVFFDGRWRGTVDFLERRDGSASAFGTWSYEVTDTKLARTTKPYFLVQLSLYSALVERAQDAPCEHMHVVLGTGERESFRVGEFAAYFRRLRTRYEALLTAGFEGTYPWPVEHCGLCAFSDHCDARRVADDNLTLVADMRRSQIARLGEAGITTVAALAEAAPGDRPRRIGAGAFERLRRQAALQVAERTTGDQRYELLEPEDGRGFALLPEPREGDLFFDMEADPFFDDGLEYLFGVTRVEDGEPVFRAFWAHDHAEEKRAFEDFIDFVMDALAKDPAIHVYHYASYERTALQRLMGRHGTREDEVDHLLRNHVLVDLYAVVRQAMRISKPSYSIKKVEAFYMDARDEAVTDGGDSIVQFERWLQTADQTLLDAIEEYNEVDCRSTVQLHRWLLERRAEAEARFGTPIPWRASGAGDELAEAPEGTLEVRELVDRLLDGLPDDLAEAGDEQRARWLLAQVVQYHRREDKPAWWAYFARLEMSQDELVEDGEAIGRLAPTGRRTEEKQSYVYELAYPEQEHKIGPGTAVDPATQATVNVVEVDEAHGLVRVKRAKRLDARPLPAALVPGQPYNTNEQRKALRRFAENVLTDGVGDGSSFRALRDVLLRRPPRVTGVEPGAPLPSDLNALVDALDDSYLFIQGPPGSGKTYTGARLIAHLLGRGARVGVAATSHKAIHNVLDELEDVASKERLSFTGLKKSSDGNPESRYESRCIGWSDEQDDFPPGPEVQLIAGTAWLWAREEMDQQVDYLFIDEAGQVSLADALAMGTSARNIVLLGDPLQLAQVSQGTHAGTSGCSVLEHLLGDAGGTVPRDRGVFLEETWRMHPDVCRFISEVVYEGRLHSAPGCERRRIDAAGALTGTGVRYLPCPHEGNTRSSVEEADVLAAAIADLLDGGIYTDENGATRPLAPNDLMVVTPYNAQVRLLTRRLPDGVRIGTVDKFQGQQAAVVFFSMATSSGAEIPRNVEFLFSRNRLNVAVSRARCLAVLVASPELLHVSCTTPEQMRLVNALCRLVELAACD